MQHRCRPTFRRCRYSLATPRLNCQPRMASYSQILRTLLHSLSIFGNVIGAGIQPTTCQRTLFMTALRLLQVGQVWSQYTAGNCGVVVCHIDSGTHWTSNNWYNAGEYAGIPLVDDDGNGEPKPPLHDLQQMSCIATHPILSHACVSWQVLSHQTSMPDLQSPSLAPEHIICPCRCGG